MPSTEFTGFKDAAEIPSSVVATLRDRFLSESASNPDKYYPEDIDKVKSNDWTVQRFLLYKKNNVDEALKALDFAMKWRKSFGVRDIKETDFPREIYQAGGIIQYGHDIHGARILIIRANIHKRIKSWDEVLRKYLVFNVEKLDSTPDGKGVVVIFDCKDAGVKNVDQDLLQFMSTTLREVYPRYASATLIHKLPKVLEYVYKMVQSWLPEEDKKYMHLTKKKNINDYVAADQLPDFMLGTNKESYRKVPPGCLSAVELAQKLKLKEGKGEKLAKHLQQYIN